MYRSRASDAAAAVLSGRVAAIDFRLFAGKQTRKTHQRQKHNSEHKAQVAEEDFRLFAVAKSEQVLLLNKQQTTV